jgi:hypothetical protein
MEDKKKPTGLVIIIVILVLSFGGYIYYKNFYHKVVKEKSVSETTQSSKYVKKITDEKFWVYDSEYNVKFDSDSYETSYDTYYAKDIVVPYININSADAQKANQSIEKLYNQSVTIYNKGVSDKINYVNQCNYRFTIIKDKFLSVVLTIGYGGTGIVHPEYYTYNFDLYTGKLVSYQDVYKLAGLTENNIKEKVVSAITNVMKEQMSSFTTADYPNGTNFDTYNNESINNYNDSVTNNAISYFIDSNNKLNIVVMLSVPNDTGSINKIVTIE